ncbi:MAG: arginine--tRNA ligase, partial [Leptolyngbya sp. SIO4C5]|nr:arginine--tRNA ligase [Leptolyngbya sp. SIO4C5]
MSNTLPPKPLNTPVPANETERLAALHRYQILDTPPEVAFDRITRLAARLFDSPIALISLVDESRAWFKSCIGFGASEVPRDATLCSFAVLTDEPLIVPDTRLDERFACNPFVQAEPGVRFYAGAPLLSHDGFNLGTLCLLDSQPRAPLTPEQQATLVDLAAMVVDELELRLAAHQIAQIDVALRSITQGVARATGGDFLKALVQHFAQVLDVNYAYISVIEGDVPKVFRTIALHAHGQASANLEYPLQGTPCWEVIMQRQICCYPRHVQAHFPRDSLLQQLAIESYMAIPFFDSSGTPLGVLGVMDGKPLEQVYLVESLLTVFADRIATELERQQVERERERFLAVASDLQVVAGTDGYFQWVSPTFERLLGWTIEEMTSRPWRSFVHPDDINSSVSETDSLFSGSPTLAFENRYRHKDGSYRWLLWNAHLYPQDQIVYGAAIDITERKQAEAALRVSEKQSRDILESITDAFFALDDNWRFTYVNQTAHRLFNRTPGDLIGKDLWEEFPGLQGSEFEQMHRRVMRDRVAESLTTFYSDHDRWYEARAYPAINGITIYFRNVTEQIQAEEALRLSEAQFRRIFECNMIGMGIWTRSGRITDANDALLDIIGYTRQDLNEGRLSWQELTPPEQAERDQRAVAEIDLRGICSPFEKDFIHKQGHRVPILLGGAGFTNNPEGGFFFAIDLSDRKEMLRKEQAAREEAERANRLGDLVVFYREAKQRFDNDADFRETSRQAVVELQAGNLEARKA